LFVCILGLACFVFFLFFALADFCRGHFGGGAGFEEEEEEKRSLVLLG
jgi:hypothetical protein